MIYVAKAIENLLLFPWDSPLHDEGCLLQTPAALCLGSGQTGNARGWVMFGMRIPTNVGAEVGRGNATSLVALLAEL